LEGKGNERGAEAQPARLQLARERRRVGREIAVGPKLGALVAGPGDLVQDPAEGRVRPVSLVHSPADRRVSDSDHSHGLRAKRDSLPRSERGSGGCDVAPPSISY